MTAADTDFKQFLAELQNSNDPHIPPKRYAEVLRLSQRRLAELAHVHRNTVGRTPHSPQLQAFLRACVDVLVAATKCQGDHRGILFWFRNVPISPFHYKTAETLVSEGRTEELLKYIETL